jgi:2-polyprenyl-6-methoxyphenol hydroxylase-like FAD-dependent oxidoreductase
VLLISFLSAIRRTERSHDSEARTQTFERWRRPRVRATGLMSAGVGLGTGLVSASVYPRSAPLLASSSALD